METTKSAEVRLLKWVKLNYNDDPDLRLVRVNFPSGAKRLVLIGSRKADDYGELMQKLQGMGFYKSRSGFMVRDDLSFSLSQLRHVFPKAAPAQLPVNEVIRIMQAKPGEAATAQESQEEAVAANNAIMAAIPLGLNFQGQTVYAGEDGRFIAESKDSIVRENGSLSPATFLYARSADDMALCADGFVREIAGGKVCRFDDLKRFASVITEYPEAEILHTPLMRDVQESVEAALVRNMSRHGRNLDKAAYRLAIRMEEGQPPLSARTSDSMTLQQFSTPLPISVVTQRILGPTAGKTILEPTIGNGSLVCSMSEAHVFGFDLDSDRIANVARERKNAVLVKADATQAVFQERNGGSKFDMVISNPPFGGLSTGRTIEGLKITRIDHLILMRSLLARKDDGLGVFIIGADSYLDRKAGQISGGSRYLFNWLEDHYQVSAVEVDGGLYAKQGSSYPIRIVVVGKKGGQRGQIPDAIPVIRDHDALFEWSNRMMAMFHPAKPAAEVTAPAPSSSTGARNSEREASASAPAGRTKAASARPEGVAGERPIEDRKDAEKPFEVAGVKFSAIRKLTPIPHWLLRTDDNGVVFESGAGGISNESVPKMKASVEELLTRVSKGDVADFRRRFGLTPEQGEKKDVEAAAAAVPASGAAVPAENAGDDLEENSYQSPYVARSRVSEATAMIPRNMATPTRNALGSVVEDNGEVDAFVAGELGWTVDEMSRYLSPEQVDAVALAIHAIQKGRGFLEADQTGLGKGRVMAAIARYSALNGTPVIFLTETPTLFTDFWRDVRDIGSEDLFTPLIVNDGVSIYDPITGNKLVASTPKTVMDRALKEDGSIDPVYNLVLGTYSQFNRAPATSAKARWIAEFAKGKTLLLDEAHNAAGESNTGKNIALAIDGAENVVYSSATSMKAGKNVLIYSKLFPETVDMGSLPETLATGGEVLQEVLSGMLAEDGAFVRREHDLSNLTFRTVTDTVRLERNRQLSDKLAEILEYMNYLSGDINVLVNKRNREIKKMLEKIPEAERKGNRMGAVNVNFGSRLFAIYRQFMMAIKTDLAAERAIQVLEEGKKPVIVLENTMESLLSDVVARNRPDILDTSEDDDGAALAATLQGETPIDGGLSFRDVLHRMLERLTYYNETGRYGDVTRVPVASEGAIETMKMIRSLIDKFPDLPVSPLDEIKRRIGESGFVCDELSGRKLEIRVRGDGLVAAPMQDRPKPQIVKDYVTGKTDGLMLTRAGSTGISLHAGEKFPDQRQRVMIELQSAADVNVRVQFFGRVNRKGQTSSPEIETLSSGLIGEARPIAMQNAKLRKLSANTTANQDNAALDRTVPDFINEIGDEVAYRYLEANPSIARRLDINLDNEEDTQRESSYFINKLTSRLVMLRVAEQEQIYEALTTEYLRVIKELDAKGTNPLKSREMDVKAREIKRDVYESGNPHSDSAFSRPVYVKTIEYEVLINPIRSDAVMQRIEASKKAVANFEINREKREHEAFFKALRDYLQANRPRFLESVCGKDIPSVEAALEAKNPNAVQKMQHRLNVLTGVLGNLYVGAVAKFTNDDGEVDYGIVTRVSVPDNPKHIHLLGAYELAFAVPGKQNLVERTLYSLQDDDAFRIMPKSAGAEKDVMDRFDKAQAGTFKMRRLILDGNLFKAAQIAATGGIGSSVIYTDEQGNRLRGVLLSRGVDMEYLQNLAVRLESPAMCASIMKSCPSLLLTTSTGKYDRDCDALLSVDNGVARLQVPGTKTWGGRFFGNDELVKVTGKFSGSRTVMVATFPIDDIEKACAVLYRAGVSLYAPSGYREAINDLNNKIYTNESLLKKDNESRIVSRP